MSKPLSELITVTYAHSVKRRAAKRNLLVPPMASCYGENASVGYRSISPRRASDANRTLSAFFYAALSCPPVDTDSIPTISSACAARLDGSLSNARPRPGRRRTNECLHPFQAQLKCLLGRNRKTIQLRASKATVTMSSPMLMRGHRRRQFAGANDARGGHLGNLSRSPMSTRHSSVGGLIDYG